MEIIFIDEKTLRRLLTHIDELKQKVKELTQKTHTPQLKDWVDTEVVCRLLCISKRTLQSYREKGFLPYAKIQHKIFYKMADVVKLLEESRVNSINKQKTTYENIIRICR